MAILPSCVGASTMDSVVPTRESSGEIARRPGGARGVYGSWLPMSCLLPGCCSREPIRFPYPILPHSLKIVNSLDEDCGSYSWLLRGGIRRGHEVRRAGQGRA